MMVDLEWQIQKVLFRWEHQIELQDFLLVESLDCHLISVSQLTQDSYCIIQMSNKLCTIQDRITKTLIGAGGQLRGLYFFSSMNVAVMLMAGCTDRLSRAVWHRLGYPSLKIVDKLHVSCSSSSAILNVKFVSALRILEMFFRSV